MKRIIILALTVFCISSCNSIDKKDANNTASSSIKVNEENSDYWYNVFAGKINDNNYTLYLSKGENFAGYLFDETTKIPITLYTNSTKKINGDSIYLTGNNQHLFIQLSGILKEGNIEGTGSLELQSGTKESFSFQFSENNNHTPFQYYFVAGHADLPPALKNGSSVDYRFGTIWPIRNDNLGDHLMQYIISKIDSQSTSIANPLQILEASKTNKISSWKKMTDTLTAESASNIGNSFSQENQNNILVLYEDDKNISIAESIYEYSGGAHGMSFTTVANFNKSSGKKINLTDLLSQEGIKALPNLLDKSARNQFNISNSRPLDKNGFLVNEINPSENYYVTKQGIGFFYAPYDIKSYADGEIILFIPFSDLEKYLKK